MHANTLIQVKHRKLNTGQLEVLNLLFRYRFGTSELIANMFDIKNGTAVRSRLKILLQRGLIDRRYDGRHKLEGKFAAYFITKSGIHALEKYGIRNDISANLKKQSYRINTASEAFISHCLSVFKICILLKSIYGTRIKFYTKQDLAKYDYFPRPLPDVFIALSVGDMTSRFFLDFLSPNTPGFAMVRRINEYIDYEAQEEWGVTQSTFPGILFVCSSSQQETKLQRRAQSTDLEISTTTLGLLADTTRSGQVWASEIDGADRITL